MTAELLDPWAPGPGAPFFPDAPGPGVTPATPTLPPTGRAPLRGTPNSGRMGWCYLLHLAEPIGAGRPRVAQAQHYLGWAKRGRLLTRVRDDLAGHGCRLMAAAVELNIGAELVRIWKADRNRERQLKQRAAARYCPLCHPGPRLTAAYASDRYLSRVRNQLGAPRDGR